MKISRLRQILQSIALGVGFSGHAGVLIPWAAGKVKRNEFVI